ncbi:MAG: hypothetical protein QW815_03855, partial [Nitrososphaerota archaeon]
MGLRGSIKEFFSTGSAKAGIVLLLIFVAISIYVITAYPLDFGVRYWSNPAHWADNPKSVPPAWANFFSDVHKVEHTTLQASEPSEVFEQGGRRVEYYRFSLDYKFDEYPTFLSLSIKNISYYHDPPSFTLSIFFNDTATTEIYTWIAPGPGRGESPPI